MLIYLMRHGIAIPADDPGAPPEDRDRPLTAEGAARTRAAARGLAALGVAPSRILVSPLRRAQETAAIAARELAPGAAPEMTDTLVPDAAPEAFWAHLAGFPRDTALLAVGHAPHLDRALALGLGVPLPVTRLKKASVACLERLAPSRPAALLWLCEPGQLRRLGA